MRIVLATSPHVRHPAVLQSDFAPDPSTMYSFAPVGLLALSATLRADLDIQPILFDTNKGIVDGSIALDRRFYQNAAASICAQDPDVLGFMTECDSYHHVLQIMEQVKHLRPDCRVMLGGPHASAVAAPTLQRHGYVDAVVIGEGERSFPDLIRAYAEDDDAPLPGVIRRRRDGSVADGGPRPLVTDLDELPMPAYELYPGSREEEIFVEAGRGCPFQCTFCSTAPYWQRRHRVKSPERILAEIRVVQQLYGSRRVHFTHDLLTTDKRWVGELCDTLVAAGVPVKWTCSARTDTVDRPLLERMAAAGCYAIYFGIESGSARVLRDIQKNVPIERSLDVLRLCYDVGIRPNAGFIAGLPTEDRESLRDTFDAYQRAFELGTRPTHIFGFCPFTASAMYGTLGEMTCDGHFLDIPIDPEIDAANRARVQSDPELYSAYFRPRVDLAPTRLQGIDEFSCLVEPVPLPTLALSRAIGGMLEVFDRWSVYIEQRNIEAGAGAHRRFYGGPLDFCSFLVIELRKVRPADDAMLQLADVMRTSFDVARRWASAPPMTMATFRSLGTPDIGEPIELDDLVRLNTIVATMRLDYDVIPLLNASPEQAPAPVRKPTCLMWDLVEGSRIRLSEVDPFLYNAIGRLQSGPQPVARLIVDWAEDSGEALDAHRLMHVLTEAKSMRILEAV